MFPHRTASATKHRPRTGPKYRSGKRPLLPFRTLLLAALLLSGIRCALAQPRIGIAYCDLDHLKYINDSHGHAEGDIYICSFVECAQQFIREEDIFARLGGDEFCIIFRNCYQDVIEQRMSEIRQAFSQGYSRYSKSFSYGLVQVPEGHGALSLNELMEQADALMYQQKKARRNAR